MRRIHQSVRYNYYEYRKKYFNMILIGVNIMTPIPLTELCCRQVFITLAELFISPWNHYPLCIFEEQFLSKCRSSCWLGNQITMMPFTREARNVGRLARNETPCSKVCLCSEPVGPYPWCGGHDGNATSLPIL